MFPTKLVDRVQRYICKICFTLSLTSALTLSRLLGNTLFMACSKLWQIDLVFWVELNFLVILCPKFRIASKKKFGYITRIWLLQGFSMLHKQVHISAFATFLAEKIPQNWIPRDMSSLTVRPWLPDFLNRDKVINRKLSHTMISLLGHTIVSI